MGLALWVLALFWGHSGVRRGCRIGKPRVAVRSMAPPAGAAGKISTAAIIWPRSSKASHSSAALIVALLAVGKVDQTTGEKTGMVARRPPRTSFPAYSTGRVRAPRPLKLICFWGESGLDFSGRAR